MLSVAVARDAWLEGSAASSGAPAVELVGVSKSFGGSPAVYPLDLQVAQGEFISLLGPSGSGKTTTLMMIAGFEQPDAGAVRIDGRDVVDVRPHRRNIGVVFQSYALFPHMDVTRNVAYPLEMRRVGKSEIAERVRVALDLVKLPQDRFGGRRPRQLSGGQQQRVALARALVYRPRVLLMDEPLGALDKNLRADMQLEIKRLHEELGIAVGYVTHDQDEAMTMSDRIALFHDGRLEQVGSPEELYERPRTRFAATFLGESNLLDVATRLDSNTCRLDDGSAVPLSYGVEAGSVIESLVVRPERIDLVEPGEGLLDGTVTEVIYTGAQRRYEIATTVGSIVVRTPVTADGQPPSVGDAVGLRWHANDSVPLTAP